MVDRERTTPAPQPIRLILPGLFTLLVGCDAAIPMTSVKSDVPTCPDSMEAMLHQVNLARAESRWCGDTWHEAASPLTADGLLDMAAETHSDNMANYGFFDHTGLDGSSVVDRVEAVGYDWQRVGENLAAGQDSISLAVQGLLDSPGHCRNIMQPDYTEFGSACASNPDTLYGIYWTQVFATPRTGIRIAAAP